VRPTRQAARFARDTGALVAFGLDKTTPLSEIKVYSLAELQTNVHALPLWHLVADSNSAPVRVFVYGQPLRGLHAAVAGSHALPLETNQVYRLQLTSGKIHGQHDFQLGINTPAPQ
jgi:hypothetical protein